jgi:hypothetical protein
MGKPCGFMDMFTLTLTQLPPTPNHNHISPFTNSKLTMAATTVDELLKHQTFKTLNEEQVASFMKHGFLRLPGAIPLENCDRWAKDVWHRLGMDPDDKSTWTTERNHMPKLNVVPAREIAPKAWAAICELCGGEDRIAKGGEMWTDSFIVNLGSPEFEGKRTPPKELDGWHVDGDFFVHFLDSPEQALLVIPCWSDVTEDAGATWVSDEGPRTIGKLLVSSRINSQQESHTIYTGLMADMVNFSQYDHPEGLNPMMGPRDEPISLESEHNYYNKLIQELPDESFHEMTGKKGDVILMHPLMLHSASRNARRLASITPTSNLPNSCSPAASRILTSRKRNNHKPAGVIGAALPVQPRQPS